MDWVSKLLEELLGQEFRNRGDIGPSALVALEGRLVGAVKDKDGMDGEGNQAKKAVVEGAQGRVGAA